MSNHEPHRVSLEVNDPIVVDILNLMASRDAKGYKKYGTTTMDNPLTLQQWCQHALEETLDKAVYLQRIIRKLEEDPDFSIRNEFHARMSKIINAKVTVEDKLTQLSKGLSRSKLESEKEIGQKLSALARELAGIPAPGRG